MLTFGLRKTKDFMPNLRKRLEELNKASFEVGYFPQNGVHAPSKLTYSGLFAIQSFGSSKVNIPPRPILDLTFSSFYPLRNNVKLKEYLRKYFKDIHLSQPRISMSKVLDNVAGDYVQNTREGFGNISRITYNKESTVRSKGFQAPLIETEKLRDNLSYTTSFRGMTIVTPS